MSKDKKSVGRKRKYNEEELREIIEKYLEAHPFTVKLQFKKIAEYANAHLNLENEVSYQDFRRNPVIKSEIESLNNVNSKPDLKINKGSGPKMVKLNVENFVDKYTNNPNMQKVILNKFNQKYEEAFNEVSKKNKKEQEYEEKILELENTIKELKSKNRRLSSENRNLTILNTRLNKVLDFKLDLDLYEDLVSRKIVSSIDAENIRILLAKAGLIKVEEMVGKEEIDTAFTEEILSDIEENNRKVMDESIDMDYDDEDDEGGFVDTNKTNKNKEVISIIDFFNNVE